MDKAQREYAAEVWRAITKNADYQKADDATKRQIRSDWQEAHVTPYIGGGRSPGAARHQPQRVDLGAEPTTIGVGTQKQPNVRQPLRQAVQPTPQPAGPPEAPGFRPGPVANDLLTGYGNTAAAKASEAAGRPLLPPGLTRPEEAGPLAMLPPLAEGLAAAVGTSLIPGVGWTAGPAAAAPLLGAPADAAAGLTPQQMRLNALGNALAGAMPAPMARALPGNQLGTAIVRNLAQGEIPVTANEAITGRQFSAMDVIPGAILGAGIDVSLGQTPAPRIRQAASDAADALQRPIPLGDLEAQRGTLGFGPKQPWQMTRQDFLGDGKVTKVSNASDLKPKVPHGVDGRDSKPIGDYTVKVYKDDSSVSYVVFDGDKPIAAHDAFKGRDGLRVNNLVVDKKYRGQGIATDLVRRMRTETDALPAQHRTRVAQSINEKVHRQSVADAIAKGKRVPADVLADYPDLAEQYKAMRREQQRGSFNPQRRETEVGGGGAADPAAPPAADPPAPPRPRISEPADRAWDNAGQPVPPADPVPPPPPRPPVDAPPAAGAAPDPVPPPPPASDLPSGTVGSDRTRTRATPAARRVYGDDVQNASGDPANVLRDVADVVDDPARPLVSREAVDAARAKVDKGDYYNWGRSGLSDDAQESMAQRIAEVVAERGLDPKARIGHDVIRAEAAKIDPELLRHLAIPKDGETLHPAVRLAARENLSAINTKVEDLRADYAARAGAMTDAEREAAAAVIDQLDRDAKRLLDILIPTRSQDGRNLAYHAITAKNTFEPDYWVLRAKRAAGLEPMNDLPNGVHDQIRALTVKGQRAQAAGDDEAVRQTRIAMSKILSKLERSSFLETWSTLVKAGLLTGPRTTMRNVGGNFAFQVMEEVSRIPAVLVDMALGGFTGNRTITGPDPRAIGRASRQAATKGVADAMEIWRHGATDNDLAKFQIPRELNTGNRVLDWYGSRVFRALSAQDAVFRNFAMRRSLEDQALLVARAEAKAARAAGQPAVDVQARRAELVEKPTEAMTAQAVFDAEVATFNNANLAGNFLRGGKGSLGKSAKGQAARFALDMTMPFTKVPINVLSRVLDYSGIGGVARLGSGAAQRVLDRAPDQNAAAALFGKLSPAEQRGISQAMGRFGVGGGLMLLGYKLAELGLMTGIPEQDEQGRKGRMDVAGQSWGAVKFGDSWRQLTGFAPGGSLLSMGASFYEQGTRKLNDVSRLPGKLYGVALKSVEEMPFMQGVKRVNEYLDNPDTKAATFWGGYGRMHVPALMGDVAMTIDGTQRQPSDFVDGAMQQVPGLRQQVPAKVDPFGREKPAPSMLDPTNSRKEDQTPAVQEIVRVEASIVKERPIITLEVETSTGEWRKVPTRLDQREHNQVQALAGEYMEKYMAELMADPWYRDPGTTDAERKAEIEKEWTNAKRDARADFLEGNAEMLEARARKQIGEAGGGAFHGAEPAGVNRGTAAGANLR